MVIIVELLLEVLKFKLLASLLSARYTISVDKSHPFSMG